MQLKQHNAANDVNSLYSDGWTVWLETTAIDRVNSTPEGAAWFKAHEKPNSQRTLEDKGFRIEFVQVVP
jgi:hypothetical protein